MIKYNILLCFMGFFLWTIHPIQVKMVPEYFWDAHRGGDFTNKCKMPCVLEENPSQPDAVFFRSMKNKHVTDAINYETNVPIKIIGTWEAPHYYSLHTNKYLKLHFQGTALFDWKSDVPWVMLYNMYEMKAAELSKNPAPKVTFIAMNCRPKNERKEYMKAIDKLIGVLSLGRCNNNAPWPQCEGRKCTKIEVIRNYKIYLAFENGDSPNYVTSNVFHAFEAGILPVYMGNWGVAEVLPKGSYIDVADFASPEDVAKYLEKVLADDDLYRSYFEWKWKPFEKKYEDRFKVLWTVPFECRMCRYIEALQKGWEWDQINQVSIIPEYTPIENDQTELELFQIKVRHKPINPVLVGAYGPQLGNDIKLLFYILTCISVILTLMLVFKKSISRFFVH